MVQAGLVSVLALGAIAYLSDWRASSAAAGDRVFELRTYYTNEGKMPDLHARFRDHTNKLFEKHGMTLIGYWSPTDGDDAANTLIYILAHESREKAAESWKAFGADPEWHKARDASEVNGKLVAKVESVYMTPTDYSPLR
jgi:hypothetical protein